MAESCPLQSQCARELRDLLGAQGLGLLLDPAFDKCYSSAVREDKKRIDGRQRPVGAARFGVFVNKYRAMARDIYSWEKVYHGTKFEFVPNIVALGYLLKYGDETPQGEKIGSRDTEKVATPNKTWRMQVKFREGRVAADAQAEFQPREFVFVSPSFAYASHDVYATPSRAASATGTKAVLEFRVKPATYQHGKQTLSQSVVDSAIPDDKFEYFTQRHGVMILTGIIIKPMRPERCTCSTWKLSIPPSPSTTIFSLGCPNALRRWNLLRYLGLNPLLFNHDFDRCYCGCTRLRDYIQEGGRQYVLPKPGTRFALHVDEARAKALAYFNFGGVWHTCFHGTKVSSVQSVVECGYLLYPGCVNVLGQVIAERGHRHDGTRIDDDSTPKVAREEAEGGRDASPTPRLHVA
jgi:hypothetical protein